MTKNLFYCKTSIRVKNLDYHYWNYKRFDLDDWSNEECSGDLRFYKADVDRLSEVLNIPQVLITYSRSEFDHIEAFCIFLKQRKTLANHVEVLGAKYANML